MLSCNKFVGYETTAEAGTGVGSEMTAENIAVERFHYFHPSSAVDVRTAERSRMLQAGQPPSSKSPIPFLQKTRCLRSNTQALLAEVSSGSAWAGMTAVGPVPVMQRQIQRSLGSTVTGCCTQNGKSVVEAPRPR